MLRTTIEQIARQHEVHKTHIQGRTKEELLRNIDKWYDGLLGHEIIATAAGSKTAQAELYRQKRDALRKALTEVTS